MFENKLSVEGRDSSANVGIPVMGLPHSVPVSVYNPVGYTADEDEEEYNNIKSGEWESGLFNCFDHFIPNCLMVTFLPCVSLAQITVRLGLYPYIHALVFFGALFGLQIIFGGGAYSFVPVQHRYFGYDFFNLQVNLMSVISGLCAIVYGAAVFYLRAIARGRYNLPGTDIEDFLVSFCCTCCTISQLATHLKSYRPKACDFAPPDTLPGYEISV